MNGFVHNICYPVLLTMIKYNTALITKTGIRKNRHRKVVWPPMIIIENARMQYVNKQWIGLNDQELTTMLLGLYYS